MWVCCDLLNSCVIDYINQYFIYLRFLIFAPNSFVHCNTANFRIGVVDFSCRFKLGSVPLFSGTGGVVGSITKCYSLLGRIVYIF